MIAEKMVVKPLGDAKRPPKAGKVVQQRMIGDSSKADDLKRLIPNANPCTVQVKNCQIKVSPYKQVCHHY